MGAASVVKAIRRATTQAAALRAAQVPSSQLARAAVRISKHISPFVRVALPPGSPRRPGLASRAEVANRDVARGRPLLAGNWTVISSRIATPHVLHSAFSDRIPELGRAAVARIHHDRSLRDAGIRERRPISSRAICVFVLKTTSSGTPATRRRARSLAQASGRYSRYAAGTLVARWPATRSQGDLAICPPVCRRTPQNTNCPTGKNASPSSGYAVLVEDPGLNAAVIRELLERVVASRRFHDFCASRRAVCKVMHRLSTAAIERFEDRFRPPSAPRSSARSPGRSSPLQVHAQWLVSVGVSHRGRRPLQVRHEVLLRDLHLVRHETISRQAEPLRSAFNTGSGEKDARDQCRTVPGYDARELVGADRRVLALVKEDFSAGCKPTRRIGYRHGGHPHRSLHGSCNRVDRRRTAGDVQTPIACQRREQPPTPPEHVHGRTVRADNATRAASVICASRQAGSTIGVRTTAAVAYLRPRTSRRAGPAGC